MVYFFRAAVPFSLGERKMLAFFGPVWPKMATLSRIYALFAVLFTSLNNVAVCQNWQIWCMIVTCQRAIQPAKPALLTIVPVNVTSCRTRLKNTNTGTVTLSWYSQPSQDDGGRVKIVVDWGKPSKFSSHSCFHVAFVTCNCICCFTSRPDTSNAAEQTSRLSAI